MYTPYFIIDTNHSTHGSNHTGCKEAHQDGHQGDGSHGDNGHKSKTIHVVEFNFDHVKTPLIFGLVVIIAGLSKIGKEQKFHILSYLILWHTITAYLIVSHGIFVRLFLKSQSVEILLFTIY